MVKALDDIVFALAVDVLLDSAKQCCSHLPNLKMGKWEQEVKLEAYFQFDKASVCIHNPLRCEHLLLPYYASSTCHPRGLCLGTKSRAIIGNIKLDHKIHVVGIGVYLSRFT